MDLQPGSLECKKQLKDAGPSAPTLWKHSGHELCPGHIHTSQMTPLYSLNILDITPHVTGTVGLDIGKQHITVILLLRVTVQYYSNKINFSVEDFVW